MTTFGDMLQQWGGVPVVPGLPLSANSKSKTSQPKYYFVDQNSGSDGNTGLSPERAKSTIAAAITVVNGRIDWSDSPWATNDVIVITPGKYAENLTALPYGATLWGLGNAYDLNGENGVTIQPASGYPVDVTSCINSRIHNIAFASPDASGCFEVENFNRNVMTNCLFSGVPGGSPTTVYGLRIKDETNADGNGDMTGNLISGCWFLNTQNGLHIEVDNGSSKQATGNIIEWCNFAGITLKGIYFHVDSVPSYTMINHCQVGDGSTTLALGLDDDTDQVGVNWCTFQATANDPATASGGKYNGCYLNGALLTQA